MTAAATAATGVRRSRHGISDLSPTSAFGLGLATLAMSLLVLIPLAAVVVEATGNGWHGFITSVTEPVAWSALQLTIVLSLAVAVVNAVMGTLIAWVLVRDEFFGKSVLEVIIDLPFALPTIVAGLVLVVLYGPRSPVGVNLSQARSGVFVALLFVTLPFVVRTVQPVLLALDRDAEEAAASLGANRSTVFRRIVLPDLVPAICAGAALSFARALSEYGSTILISGNLARRTQVASVQVLTQIENDDTAGAAAVAVVLLVAALVVIVALDLLQRWAARRA